MTALIAVQVLGTVVTPEVLNSQLMSIIIKLAEDPVPNIRFNAAKTLQKLIPRIDGSVVASQVRTTPAISPSQRPCDPLNLRAPCLTQVKPTLNLMCEDQDDDVRYYAAKALAVC